MPDDLDTNPTEMVDPALYDILKQETLTPPDRVIAVMDSIKSRHQGRVLAFLYYGSSLRALDDHRKMLDFYVLVDSYRKTHKNPIRAVLNSVIPPAVYYLEHVDKDNILSHCKYSILSLRQFERKCGKAAFLSQIWGRFSQPCLLLAPKSAAIENRIIAARIKAIKHMASQTAPLINSHIDAEQFWGRGFYESYRTEIRPESSVGRSTELVKQYDARYKAIMTALYGTPDKMGLYSLPKNKQPMGKFKWFLRRIIGKPAAAIRIINSAATFDGGLDYVLRKIENHSGVSLTPSPFQRKHPVICSPILAWRLWRMGAFGR